MPSVSQQHLVRARRVGRAARGGHHAVRLDGIGNDRGLALEGDVVAVVLDRSLAGTHIAAGLAFGGRGCHQQLFGGNSSQNPFERGVALGMPHDAGHLDLMHGVNQGRGRASLTQDVTHVGYFRDAGAFSAESLRNLDAEKPLLADFCEGFAGEASFHVDRRGVCLRHFGSSARARGQVDLTNGNYAGASRYSLRFH